MRNRRFATYMDRKIKLGELRTPHTHKRQRRLAIGSKETLVFQRAMVRTKSCSYHIPTDLSITLSTFYSCCRSVSALEREFTEVCLLDSLWPTHTYK